MLLGVIFLVFTVAFIEVCGVVCCSLRYAVWYAFPLDVDEANCC